MSEAAPETVARPAAHSMPPARPINAALKRGLDVVVSLLGLVLASPFLLAAAIAVKLDSRGPLLFRQQRMGRNFRPFWIYKFRTMVVDAERQGQLTAGADPRVTRVGRWLRQSKLDELPQLFNVLRGDMSLVGPRPEVTKYVELFRDEYRVVLSVRPGLTDPASIKYRDEASLLAGSPDPERQYVEQILPDKLALASNYIRRANVLTDLGVLFRTALRIAR